MPNEFIRPNWHVALIHYPLALLTIGLLVEIFSFLWRRSTLRTAGRWMILLGALLALPAATSGIYAFRDVVAKGEAEPHDIWHDVAAKSHWSDEQWGLMKRHVIYASAGTAVTSLSLLAWLAVSDRTRRRVHWPLVVVCLVGLGCLSTAAWYSGEAIYRHGTAVEPPGADRPTGGGTADAHHGESDTGGAGYALEDLLPPMQVHVVFAGLTVAAAVVALGLSLHWWRRERRFRVDQLKEHLAAVDPAEIPPAAVEAANATGSEIPMAPPDTPAAPPGTVVTPPADRESAEAAAIMGSTSSMPFPARYWLLTLLLGAAAFASGLWQANDWKFQALAPDGWQDENRLAWHTVLAIVIPCVVLLLVLLTALLRRLRLIGYLAALLLVLTVAAQVALGTLMLYDSTTGSLFHFQPPDADNDSSAESPATPATPATTPAATHPTTHP